MPLIAVSISTSSVTSSTYSPRTRSNTSPNSFSCRNVSDEPACGMLAGIMYAATTASPTAATPKTLVRINL